MIELFENLTQTLKNILPESYHEVNPKKAIIYPYLVFRVDTMELERNTEEVSLELDLFDSGSSQARLLELAGKIKTNFKYKRDLTANFLLIYRFKNDLEIPTLVDNLQRRNMQFAIKTIYRKGEY
jgi:hypothetical protein